VNSGFQDTQGSTITATFNDSTAVSTQSVTTASVTLNDADSTEGGCKPNPCHNPLPNQPSVNVYLDKSFGSFMFQDPYAPPAYARTRVPKCCLVLINSLIRREIKHPRFSDVRPGDPASGAIGLLARIHVLAGLPNGTFQPNGPFTRAQLATALATALALPSAGGSTVFSDVPSNDPAATAIASATKAELIVTPSATKFGPSDAVTRQDLAVSLARAFKLKLETESLSDSPQIASYAKDAVSTVAAMGYLPAYPGRAFQPTTTLTREQAAQALFLALRDYTAQGSPK
jgi:S-layer homology domain